MNMVLLSIIGHLGLVYSFHQCDCRHRVKESYILEFFPLTLSCTRA